MTASGKILDKIDEASLPAELRETLHYDAVQEEIAWALLGELAGWTTTKKMAKRASRNKATPSAVRDVAGTKV